MILKGGSMLCPRRRHWFAYAGQWLRGLAYGVESGRESSVRVDARVNTASVAGHL